MINNHAEHAHCHEDVAEEGSGHVTFLSYQEDFGSVVLGHHQAQDKQPEGDK